jgi:putative DNA primase/helicase
MTGKLVAEHLRKEFPDGSKTFAWRRGGATGLDGLPVRNLPLFGIEDLAGAPPGCAVVVTEGEKSCNALKSRGILALGTVTGAKVIPADDQLRPLVAYSPVLWADNDDDGRKHMDRIAARLSALSATPKLVRWPDAPPKGDAADFPGTDAELRELLDTAALYTPGAPSVNGAKPKPPKDTSSSLVVDLADAITFDHHFAQDAGGKLYVYQGGRYVSRGTEFVKSQVKGRLDQWGQAGAWTTHKADEVVEYIRVDAPRLWERPSLAEVNVLNGLLDVGDLVLAPHNPDFLSPVQLPVTFAPQAKCPGWEAFVQQVFPSDTQELPWELLAWLMLPDTSIQRAVLLLGEGGAGKSRFLAAVRAFLGIANTSTVSLHRLESDRFSVARLIGRLANLFADLPSEHLASTATFKGITGGDSLSAEYKFRDSFDFTPFCRLIFSANTPPRSKDGSQAFFDRWLTVPLNRVFRGTPEEVPAPMLDAQLSAPQELSGALNRALAVLPRLRARHGFEITPSMLAVWEEFRSTTDPLAVWLDRATMEGAALMVPCADLLREFNTYAESAGIVRMTVMGFGVALQRLRPAVEVRQRTVAGRLVRVYIGLGLSETSRTSRTSRTSPSYTSPAREDEKSGEQERVRSHVEQDRQKSVKSVKCVKPQPSAEASACQCPQPTHFGPEDTQGQPHCVGCGGRLWCAACGGCIPCGRAAGQQGELGGLPGRPMEH